MTPLWLQRGQSGFDSVERFISARIWGASRPMPGDTQIVSIDTDGSMAGAAIYQNYDPSHGTIELSAAAVTPRWLARNVLYEMFEYPFDQLGCQAVVMRCDPEDGRLARIFRAYGFKRYDIPRLRGRDRSEAIYVLADEDWRSNGFHKENADG